MEMLGKVRRMHLRDKLSLHAVSKCTGLSRNTLLKWLRNPAAAVVAPPRYVRGSMRNKLTPYHATLEQALKADAHRIKQNRRTSKALFEHIKADGYAGSYRRVTEFTREWRGRDCHAPQAFVPLSFEQGEAFQFDWSEEGLVVGGIYRRMQVSHLKLCASGALWLVAYPSEGHEMLFDAHTRSFAALGGVPRRGIYNNMKTAVDKVNKGKGRIVNARSQSCALTTCSMRTSATWHRAGKKPWSKIKCTTAAAASGSRRRPASSPRSRNSMRGLASDAGRYGASCVTRSSPRERGGRTGAGTVAMMPMPTAFDGYVEKAARVSSTCLVTVSRNRYSVPCEFAGQMVNTHLYPGRVCVVAGDTVAASHDRTAEHGQVCYDWQHFIPLVQR